MPTDLDAASFLLAVLAFLLSVGAILYTRRSTKAAERSAVAAEVSAQAAARSAAVDERNEQRQLEEAEARAVVWDVRRTGSAALRLTNVGEATAHDVRVVVPSGAGILGRPLPDGVSVHRGSSIVIGASELRSRDEMMNVFWRLEPGGPERSWQHPL